MVHIKVNMAHFQKPPNLTSKICDSHTKLHAHSQKTANAQQSIHCPASSDLENEYPNPHVGLIPKLSEE